MTNDQKIRRFAGQLRRWIFVRNLLETLPGFLLAGTLAALVMELISCRIPWYGVHYWAGGVLLLSVLAALLRQLVQYPSSEKAAGILDATGLKERTMTALELIGDDSLFAVMQKNDTWEILSGLSVTKRLPVKWNRKQLALLLVSVLFFSFSIFLPSPAREQAAVRHEVKKTAEKEIEKIEKLEQLLKKEEQELDEKERREYEELLASIIEELKQADTKESLKKAMERAEKKLEQTPFAQKKENENALKEAGMQAEAAEKAQKKLEQLMNKMNKQGTKNLESVDEAMRQEAKEALEQLAGQITDKELAEALLQEAEQIASGTATAQQLAAANASVTAIRQSANKVLASAENNPGSGENGNQSEGGNNSGNGNSSGNGSGSGNGNGSGSGNGSGNGNGSGSGSGSGNGNGSGSGNGSGTGWNYGNNVGTEAEGSYHGEMVSIPNQVGNDGNLTGTQGDGSSYVTQGGEALTWSGNQVEYGQVIGEYSRQAMSQINQASYPPGVQDIIRNYFETLNQ